MDRNLQQPDGSITPMSDDELDRANVKNLTAVWRAMGTQPQTDGAGLQACDSWPHRHWFDREQILPDAPVLREIISSLPARAQIPVWGEHPELEKALRAAGFQCSLEQRAMHLTLARWQTVHTDSAFRLRRVNSAIEVADWTNLCSRAFGYDIDVAVMDKLAGHPDASLWLAEINGDAVGTAMLFRTGEIWGIHQVGVPGAFRGRGIARSLMQALLNHCQQLDARYVTLQASQMGEGLYRQLGFERRFQISTYRRS